MDFKTRAKKLKSGIPALFIALKKKETPIIAKVFAGITIGYALSPIDLIPDFIPIIGLLDDLIILPMLIAITIKFIPEEIFKRCRVESESLWKNGKPKKWYFSVSIILLWVLFMSIIIKLVIS